MFFLPPILIGMAYASHQIRENQMSIDALRSQTTKNTTQIVTSVVDNTRAVQDLNANLSREGNLLREQLLEMHLAFAANKEVACPYCNQLISSKALICNECQGILNFGPWDFIRIALMHDPSLILRDMQTIQRLQIMVSDIEREVLRIASEEAERNRLEQLKKKELLELEQKRASKELELREKAAAREVAQREAKIAKEAETRKRQLETAETDFAAMLELDRLCEESDTINPAEVLKKFKACLNLSVSEYQSVLSKSKVQDFALAIQSIGESIMVLPKLSIKDAEIAMKIFDHSLDFGILDTYRSICRTFLLSRQFVKCSHFVDAHIGKENLANSVFDGMLLDKLKADLFKGVAKIGHVHRVLDQIRDSDDHENLLVIAAAALYFGDATTALRLRDSISLKDLQSASLLYEPDFDDTHLEIAEFDQLVCTVIES
jgi:hypothetical protein